MLKCQKAKFWNSNHIIECAIFYRLSFRTSVVHYFYDISARVILHPRPKIRCDAENLKTNIAAL